MRLQNLLLQIFFQIFQIFFRSEVEPFYFLSSKNSKKKSLQTPSRALINRTELKSKFLKSKLFLSLFSLWFFSSYQKNLLSHHQILSAAHFYLVDAFLCDGNIILASLGQVSLTFLSCKPHRAKKSENKILRGQSGLCFFPF